MLNLGLPHLTILSKCDLIKDESIIDHFLKPKQVNFNKLQPKKDEK